MRIATFRHKGLRRFYNQDDARGLPPAAVAKIRKILTFLQTMSHPSELRSLTTWNAHRLTGPRAGTWSLSVTRNWRLTFTFDASTCLIRDVDLEDYH